MSIDVYDDHIRYLGYHVPIDTSKLPPTARDALVSELQGGVDRPENAADEEINEAVREARQGERDLILDAFSEHIEAMEDALEGGDEDDIGRAIRKLRKTFDEFNEAKL